MKRMFIQITALVAASVLLACGGSQTKDEIVQVSTVPGIPNGAVSAFNDGVEQLRSSPPNYRDALASFQDAVRQHPTYRVAKLNAAICLEKTGRYKEAAGVYQELVSDYVEDASVFMAYGNALLLSGETGLAIDQFERVISLDDKNLEAKNNLAAAYLRKGEPERSREFVKEVLAVQPDNVPALINLGLYYQRKKNMELAMLMFNNAIGHETAKGKPLNNAVVSKKAPKSKTDDKASQAEAKEAIKTKPGTPNPVVLARAENNLGMTWFLLGVMPNAVHHFKRAVELDPSMNEARMNLASIYLDYLAYQNALVEFETVLNSNPRHYEAMIGTADAMYGVGKYKEAAELFERSFALNKKNVEAITRLGEIYHKKLNDSQKAMETYRLIQTETGLSASDKAYKRAGQLINAIKVEIQAAKQFEAEAQAKEAAAGTAAQPQTPESDGAQPAEDNQE